MRSRRQIKKLLKKCEGWKVEHNVWVVMTKRRGDIYVTREEVENAGINYYDIFMKQGLYP